MADVEAAVEQKRVRKDYRWNNVQTNKIISLCLTIFQMKEMFGAGTACVVCPVKKIMFMEKEIDIPTKETGDLVATRFYKELTDIQVGANE